MYPEESLLEVNDYDEKVAVYVERTRRVWSKDPTCSKKMCYRSRNNGRGNEKILLNN